MQLSLKLMLYCGIRPAEVTRIDPQRDIVGDELIIRPNTSKTGGGRVVPLRKVATFVKRHRGALTIPDRWEQRWRALRRAARFRIRRLTDGLEPELLGCVPRCILAAAPTANAWKPQWDETVSLYEMPDTTAVALPGRDIALLSSSNP